MLREDGFLPSGHSDVYITRNSSFGTGLSLYATHTMVVVGGGIENGGTANTYVYTQ
jgi:hypothetical protein